MRVFITGATGFVGRSLVKRMLDESHEVIALSRAAQTDFPPQVRVVRGDILDPDSLGQAGVACDRLYHLAAYVTFEPKQREQLFKINAQGTANLLAKAHQWKIPQTVVVSSACTIGIAHRPEQTLDEEALLDCTLASHNPYLASKLATEEAARMASLDQPVVIVNPSTIYGEGDRSLNSGTLIQKVSKAILLPVPPGGSNVIDVEDVVSGILAAGEFGISGRRYILSHHNLRFSEILSTVAQVTGNKPKLIPVPRACRIPLMGTAWMLAQVTGGRFLTPQVIGDMFNYKFYSNARAQQELGWIPQKSFQSSVEHAWDYYLKKGLIRPSSKAEPI
jgi:dihydroflavonol-4-reductase